MEIRWLEDFIALAKTRHFSRAADERNVTQTLFLSFYKDVIEPFNQEIDMDLDSNLKSSSWSGMDFINALIENQCDLMLCFWHPAIPFIHSLEDDSYEYCVIADEKLIPFSIVNDDGDAKYLLPGDRRRPLPHIGYYDNSFLQPVILHHLQRQKDIAQLKTINENYHSINVKAMIKEGFGIGWVPSRLMSDTLEYGKVALAGEKEWHIPLEIRLYRSKINKKTNLNAFWESLKERLKHKKRF